MDQQHPITEMNEQNNRSQAPMGLKVLTVLTFIGSIIQFCGALWNFFNAQKNFDGMDKLVEQINSDSMPSWVKSMIGDPAHLVETITKSYQNRIPIVLLTVIAASLCFYGALQMRRLRKQGFMFYTIGELLPFLTQFLFIGAFSLSGVLFTIMIGLSLLFILLYFMQRKNMLY